MKIYTVVYKPHTAEEEYEQFYSITAAKALMKRHPGSTGSITKVYSNGDWEPCGPINLNGNNAVQMSNQRTKTYN